MENDNEVKSIIEKSKQTFLTDELLNQHAKPEIYSLDAEFAATRKNRKPWFVLLLLLFLGAIGVGSYMFTLFLQSQSKRQVIPIADFEDINLQEILNRAKKTEAQLEFAVKELMILREEKQKKVQTINDEYTQKGDELRKSGIPPAQLQVKLDGLNKQKQEEIQGESESYNKKIKYKEEEVATIRNNIAEERNNIRKETDKVQSAINNYQKLFDLKLDKVRKEYERKMADLILLYNPYITEANVAAILRSNDYPYNLKPVTLLPSDEYTRMMSREGAWTATDQSRLKKGVRAQFALIDRLRKVPYKNSVPGALNKIQGATILVVNDYEGRLGKLYQIVNSKNAQIANYHYAFDYLLYSRPENGYIIDARNSARVRVYINEVNKIKDGIVASVFRNDDEFIGEISLYRAGGGVYAKVMSTSTGKSIKPFDKILLKIE